MNKRFFWVIFCIVCFLFATMAVNAETVSLSQVVDAFNNCKTVQQYKEYEMECKAETKDNQFIITIENAESTSKAEFTIQENILSGHFSSGDALTGLMSATILTDSVGQLHGYEDGELFETLNSEQISSYTIDNEGFEIKELEDGSYEVKIDINKKLPLADFSNTYIDISDFGEFAIDIMHSDEAGSYNGSKGPLAYSFEKYDNLIIYIAERDGLTDRAYRSILSFIKAIFDSEKAVEYFKNQYPSLEEGNKSFDGFEVYLNIDEEDMPSFDERASVLKLVIDKAKVENLISGENSITNPDTMNGGIAPYPEKEPTNMVLVFGAIGLGLIIVIIIIVVIALKKRK